MTICFYCGVDWTKGQGDDGHCENITCIEKSYESVEKFWHSIEKRLWDMISEINAHYYSRPHDVDNFAYQLADSNKHLKLVQQDLPDFNKREVKE